MGGIISSNNVYIYKGIKGEKIPKDVLEVKIAEGVIEIHESAFENRIKLTKVRKELL